MRLASCSVVAAMLLLNSNLRGAEPGSDDLLAPAPLSNEEPLAREFSLLRAAESLDTAALHWQRTRKCAACHTLPPFLMARPVLAAVSPEPLEVRKFFETLVEQHLEGEPALPKDGVTAVVLESAVALAFHDRATTGKLHPLTRQQLDHMWSRQREDGGWDWPYRDTPPFKSDEHYGAVLAALGTGAAPDGYSRSEAAQKGLAGIRRFLKAHPATSLHQKTMLLWASSKIEGLQSPDEKEQTLRELFAAQRPEGGWSLASLIENPNDPARQNEAGRAARSEAGHGREFLIYVGRDKVYRSSLSSDGYATGFVIYVLREAGKPSDDPAIRRGIAWLKGHQRESGRWFTPSQGWHTQNYVSNIGTAFAVLALHACGETPSPKPAAASPP